MGYWSLVQVCAEMLTQQSCGHQWSPAEVGGSASHSAEEVAHNGQHSQIQGLLRCNDETGAYHAPYRLWYSRDYEHEELHCCSGAEMQRNEHRGLPDMLVQLR